MYQTHRIESFTTANLQCPGKKPESRANTGYRVPMSFAVDICTVVLEMSNQYDGDGKEEYQERTVRM